MPLCVGHKLVTLAELLFTKGALEPTCVLVDPLVDSSNLPVKELLSTSATLVLSLPAVTNHVAFQGGLGAALFSTGWAKFLRLVSIVVSHLVVDHGRPGVEHLLTLVALNILCASVQERVSLQAPLSLQTLSTLNTDKTLLIGVSGHVAFELRGSVPGLVTNMASESCSHPWLAFQTMLLQHVQVEALFCWEPSRAFVVSRANVDILLFMNLFVDCETCQRWEIATTLFAFQIYITFTFCLFCFSLFCPS